MQLSFLYTGDRGLTEPDAVAANRVALNLFKRIIRLASCMQY